MYYFVDRGNINKKIGGSPPSNDYVAIDPSGTVRHIVNDSIIQEEEIGEPQISKKQMDEMAPHEITLMKILYTNGTGYKIAKRMLAVAQRKKKSTKSKSKRKPVKKCKCK